MHPNQPSANTTVPPQPAPPPYPTQPGQAVPQQPAQLGKIATSAQQPADSEHVLPRQADNQQVPQQADLPPQQQLVNAVASSQELLCKASTVFPFVLFPDSIAVDREKVTITHTSFFKTGDTASIHIDDILNVTANVGPFFGSIALTIRNIPQHDPPTVRYLTRKDVLCVKNILQGYIIARQNNIDCASLPKDQLISMLQRLGTGQSHAASP